MKNLILIHGKNTFQSSQVLKKILSKYPETEAEIIESDKVEFSSIKSDLNTMPFLSDKRLIILNDFFKTADKEEQEEIVANLEKIPDFLILIINEKKSLDKRFSSYKKLKKIAEINESIELTDKTAPIWLRNYLKEKNINAESNVPEFLVKHSGSFSEWKLINEIGKLKTFAQEKPITKEMIISLVPEALSLTIFNLTEAVSDKNKTVAIGIIKKMTESGQDPFFIFNMLIRQFRILIMVKDLREKEGLNADEISKKINLHIYPTKLAIPQSKNFSQDTLDKIHQELLKIDIATKSNDIKTSTTDTSELTLALEKLILNFCNRG